MPVFAQLIFAHDWFILYHKTIKPIILILYYYLELYLLISTSNQKRRTGWIQYIMTGIVFL